MILTAKLYIKGHRYEMEGIQLISCDYQFSQAIDSKGLTTSRVQGGLINVTFNSIEDNDIIQWMISEDADKDGKIVFRGENNTKDFKTMEFKDARLVGYKETFTDSSLLITSLNFSARQLILSGITHTNLWLGYECKT